MSEHASLLKLLRALAAAGHIGGKVFIRDGGPDVQAHILAVDVHDPPRTRHLVRV